MQPNIFNNSNNNAMAPNIFSQPNNIIKPQTNTNNIFSNAQQRPQQPTQNMFQQSSQSLPQGTNNNGVGTPNFKQSNQIGINNNNNLNIFANATMNQQQPQQQQQQLNIFQQLQPPQTNTMLNNQTNNANNNIFQRSNQVGLTMIQSQQTIVQAGTTKEKFQKQLVPNQRSDIIGRDQTPYYFSCINCQKEYVKTPYREEFSLYELRLQDYTLIFNIRLPDECKVLLANSIAANNFSKELVSANIIGTLSPFLNNTTNYNQPYNNNNNNLIHNSMQTRQQTNMQNNNIFSNNPFNSQTNQNNALAQPNMLSQQNNNMMNRSNNIFNQPNQMNNQQNIFANSNLKPNTMTSQANPFASNQVQNSNNIFATTNQMQSQQNLIPNNMSRQNNNIFAQNPLNNIMSQSKNIFQNNLNSNLSNTNMNTNNIFAQSQNNLQGQNIFNSQMPMMNNNIFSQNQQMQNQNIFNQNNMFANQNQQFQQNQFQQNPYYNQMPQNNNMGSPYQNLFQPQNLNSQLYSNPNFSTPKYNWDQEKLLDDKLLSDHFRQFYWKQEQERNIKEQEQYIEQVQRLQPFNFNWTSADNQKELQTILELCEGEVIYKLNCNNAFFQQVRKKTYLKEQTSDNVTYEKISEALWGPKQEEYSNKKKILGDIQNQIIKQQETCDSILLLEIQIMYNYQRIQSILIQTNKQSTIKQLLINSLIKQYKLEKDIAEDLIESSICKYNEKIIDQQSQIEKTQLKDQSIITVTLTKNNDEILKQIFPINNKSFYPQLIQLADAIQTVPPFDELLKLNQEQLEKLKNFKIISQNLKIEFQEEVDITYINFDNMFQFTNKRLGFHFIQLFQKGTKINKPAILTIKLPDQEQMSEEQQLKLEESLKNQCIAQQIEFLNYNKLTRSYQTKVQYF